MESGKSQSLSKTNLGVEPIDREEKIMTVVDLSERRRWVESSEGVLQRNGTIWIVSTSGWSGNDRLRADDLGLSDEQVPDDLFKLGNKHLISDEWRIKLSSTSGKLSAFMSRMGKLTPFGRGIYWIPDGEAGENLMATVNGFEKLEREQQAMVTGFLSIYEEEKAKRIAQHPVLANAVWPTPSVIQNKFRLRKVVLQGLRGAEARETDPAELVAAKRKFNADLQSAYDEYIRSILAEVHAAILESCDEIEEKVMEAGDKVTEATLKKPRSVIDRYMVIGEVFDLDEVKTAVQQLKDTIDAQQAKAIRTDFAVRKEFAASIRAQADNIGTLVGVNREGRVKRQVKAV